MPKILQLKISLNEIKPEIWRRFLVYDNISFNILHEIIQKIMGWENYHLYEFNIDGRVFGLIDNDALDANPELIDSEKIKLKDYLKKERQKFEYLYDFGDSWEHTIIVEKISGENGTYKQVPICIEGERACPPEDCGGIWGYEELIEIKKDKKHPDYGERIKDWLGEDFNFEDVDLKEVNKRMKKSA